MAISVHSLEVGYPEFWVELEGTSISIEIGKWTKDISERRGNNAHILSEVRSVNNVSNQCSKKSLVVNQTLLSK